MIRAVASWNRGHGPCPATAKTIAMGLTCRAIATAIATAIVTGVMASSGYEPTLDAVTTAQGGEGVVIAFTNGLRTAYLVMIACIGLALLLSLVKGRPLQRTKSDGFTHDLSKA